MAAPIPVIDLAGADTDGPARDAVAKALVDAAVEHGFVYIRNSNNDSNSSNIPAAAIANTFAVSRKLFALPTAEKQACAIQTNNRGWTGVHVETLDPKTQRVGDTKEAFNFGEFGADGKPQQPLPAAIEGDASSVGQFFDLCYQLCLTLNELLGIGLAVDPPDFFAAAHRKEAGPSGNTLRLLYYPPRGGADDTEAIRAGAHSDYGSMTLLFRLAGQAGLEINTKDGRWVPVPVQPAGAGIDDDDNPPILVNIGDLLEYWTGGLLRSTVHRVAFPPPGGDADATTIPGETTSEPRYSIAFFCHPAGASALNPIPSARVQQAVAEAKSQGRPIPASDSEIKTADDHLQMRLRSTYLSLYEKK